MGWMGREVQDHADEERRNVHGKLGDKLEERRKLDDNCRGVEGDGAEERLSGKRLGDKVWKHGANVEG